MASLKDIDWKKVRNTVLDHGLVYGQKMRTKAEAYAQAKKPLEELVQEKQKWDTTLKHLRPAMHFTIDAYNSFLYAADKSQDPRFHSAQLPHAFMTNAAVKEWYFAYEEVQVAQEQHTLYQPWTQKLLDDMKIFEDRFIFNGIPPATKTADGYSIMMHTKREFLKSMSRQIRQAERISTHYQARIEKLEPEYLKAKREFTTQAGVSVAASLAIAYVGGVLAAKTSVLSGKAGQALQVAISAAKKTTLG